jgi:hypothetical protein
MMLVLSCKHTSIAPALFSNRKNKENQVLSEKAALF